MKNDNRYLSDRKRKDLRSKGGSYPTSEFFRNKHVYVDKRIDDCLSIPVIQRLELKKSETRVGASVFVVPRLDAPGERILWASILVGGYVTTISALSQTKGIGFKNMPALHSTRRRVCFSPLFSERHSVLERIIRDSVQAVKGSKWKIVDGDVEEFKKRKELAKQRRKPNSEIRLVTKSEKKTDPLGNTIDELAELVDQKDLTLTTQGVCGR